MARGELVNNPKKIYSCGHRQHMLLIKKEYSKKIKNRATRVVDVLCDCGVEKTMLKNALNRGARSCGCYKRVVASLLFKNKLTTHGMSKKNELGKRKTEYVIWLGMKARCYYKNCREYPRYGGRGISVCPEWKNSFINFYKDMGERPSKNHSIDRIDVNGNYTKSNCRWATQLEQSNNRRSHRKVIAFGAEMNLSEAVKKYSELRYSTVYRRIYKHKMSVEESLTKKGRKCQV